jgi:hypothetical protein
MADRASLFLSANDATDFENDTLIVEGHYACPLCWLAMASAEDLRTPSCTDSPMLVISLEDARRRFTARLPLVQEHFKNTGPWLSAWQQMLETASEPYLKVDVSDILSMYLEEVETLTGALAFFEHPAPEALTTLLQLTMLRDKYNKFTRTLGKDDSLPYLLVGIKIAEWLPWTDPADEVKPEAPAIIAPAPDPEPIPQPAEAEPRMDMARAHAILQQASRSTEPTPATSKPATARVTAKKAADGKPWWQVWKK